MSQNENLPNPDQQESNSPEVPFFARYLEGQLEDLPPEETESISGGTGGNLTGEIREDLEDLIAVIQKFPSDSEDSLLIATRKYPSDHEDLTAVTLKYPSDHEEGDFVTTLKYPSDHEDV